MSIYHFMPTIDAILNQIPRNTGVADASLSFNKTGDGMIFSTYATLDGESYLIKMNYRTHRDEKYQNDDAEEPTDIYGELEMEFYLAGHQSRLLTKEKLTVTEKQDGVKKRPTTRGKLIKEQINLACMGATLQRNKMIK